MSDPDEYCPHGMCRGCAPRQELEHVRAWRETNDENATLRARLAQLEAQAEQMRQALERMATAHVHENGACVQPISGTSQALGCHWVEYAKAALVSPWVSGTEGGKR